jgi:hypothetical protein
MTTSRPKRSGDSPGAPPIPVHLAGQRTVAGLVVPFITARHADGSPVFGGLDDARREQCLLRRLCQICGTGLGERIVILARPQDIAAGYAPEPALHPECATYSTRACPMLSHRKDHYRRQPLNVRRCGVSGCWCQAATRGGSTDNPRAGHPSETWKAIWIAAPHYQVHRDERGRAVGVQLEGVPVLRTRTVVSASWSPPASHESHPVLLLTLQLAVPLTIAEVADWSFEQREEAAREGAAAVAQHGDDLLYGGRHCAATFNQLALGLAVGAYQPGGVTFANAHWCVHPHPECPNGNEADEEI